MQPATTISPATPSPSAPWSSALATIIYTWYREAKTAAHAGKPNRRIVGPQLGAARSGRARAQPAGDARRYHRTARQFGRITYANDAFCGHAGKPREALIGCVVGCLFATAASLRSRPTAPGCTKKSCSGGARWISWREVAVRSEIGTEIQSVGRDVTSRVEAEQALRWRAIRPKPRTAPNRASSPRSVTKFARRSTASSAWPIVARHAAHAGAAHLHQGCENLGRDVADIDRGDSRLLEN